MDIPIKKIPQNAQKMERIENISNRFYEEYDTLPEFYARAPGRVNIIGEHIDYCGYAVLPMAIDQDIVIGVARRSDKNLMIKNYDVNYGPYQCDINNIDINDGEPSWFKYVLCAIKGLREDNLISDQNDGLSMLIHGNIPPAAGLSSSSALVSGAALAFVHAFNVQMSLHELAEFCARAERFIGTQGGGMDQAASFLSLEGCAQVIEFNPLKCTMMKLPSGLAFVVANSLVQKEKAASSDFNCRVVECRLAAKLIAVKCGLDSTKIDQLGALQKSLEKSLPEMEQLASEILRNSTYNKKELCEELNISMQVLEEKILTKNTRAINAFDLQKRAVHVYSEANRVWEFKRVCSEWQNSTGDRSSGSEEWKGVVSELGILMNASHISTRFLYECSHPSLDELVDLSADFSIGARLTGAGWGGCIIALVRRQDVNEYKKLLAEKFYLKRDIKGDLSTIVFGTEPSGGACVHTL